MAKERVILIGVVAAGIIAAMIGSQYFGGQIKPAAQVKAENHPETKNEGKGHGDPEKVIQLHDEDRKEFGIEVKEAGRGKLTVLLELPGEIAPNADRLVSIVPRVPGVVRTVLKSLGDTVQAGETLAVLESKELADTKAAYLSASKRVEIARVSLNREETLYQKKISPEIDYLEARKAYDETQIELKSAEQKLHAIGFADQDLLSLPSHPDMTYTRYEMKAPFSGTVIEKHISLGSVLKDDAVAFVIADMDSVWVNISVYQKDLGSLRKGQPVVVSVGSGIPDAKGVISYISPVTGQETRTATARVVLPNEKGILRPGLFVTAKLAVDEAPVSILIPKTALASGGGKTEVFVEAQGGFKPQAVALGRSNDTHVEVTAGLQPGQKYVAKGSFALKAQMSKGAFGDGHNH